MAKKILGTRKEKKQAEKILDTLTGKNDDLDNDKIMVIIHYQEKLNFNYKIKILRL